MNTEPTGESPPDDSPKKHSGRARWLTRLVAVFLLVLALAVGLFVGSFLRFSRDIIHLEPPRKLTKADGIVVLTGGSRRIDQAVELLDGGQADRLLISGVFPATTASQIQRLTQAEPALFECCVDIDHDALDTIGNANETAAWVQKHGYKDVILVTSNYHMPRSLMLLRRVDGKTNYIPYPVVATDLRHLQWLQQPGAIRMLAAEYLKYLAARFRLNIRRSAGDGLPSS
ncbi:MAG: YdcF family protein [Hyphomicrobiales bacterium]|nr:YdcF family protein [Hyphomicrobiales bacterium]MCP4998337.1 YdcF family protein [Hyphomicrobiales bacterium]